MPSPPAPAGGLFSLSREPRASGDVRMRQWNEMAFSSAVDRTSVDDRSPLTSNPSRSGSGLSFNLLEHLSAEIVFKLGACSLARSDDQMSPSWSARAALTERAGQFPSSHLVSADGNLLPNFAATKRKTRRPKSAGHLPSYYARAPGIGPPTIRRPRQQPGALALTKIILACQKLRCSELATAARIR